MADVVVFGIDPSTVFLDDIQMDVPHARTVTIPEEKALRSKELWRAISQKRIFRLSHDPNPKFAAVPSTPPATPEMSNTTTRLTEIMAENAALREEVLRLRAQVKALEARPSDGKLDEILMLLRTSSVPFTVRGEVLTAQRGTITHQDLVEMDAPTFVPSAIRPKDVETRVEVSAETSKGGSVSDATEVLRRLRQSQ